jgi:predicted CoA-substrate-specific enzyme activase
MNDTPAAIGVDIGSRMTKVVRIQGDRLTDERIFDTGYDPMTQLKDVLAELEADVTVATGYGRHMARAHLDCKVITEIRACARGAGRVGPGCSSAIDIGGQDTKAIELAGDGSFGRFEMNDRCAAGTGRFLEVMAHALGFSLDEFAAEAMQADLPVQINSMCTVFAESEVVSLIARGEDRRRIALGLHTATARRVAAMASRIHAGDRVLFVGGVARNACMVRSLDRELAGSLIVPERPELVVAFGAALVGLDDLVPA